MTPEEKEQYEYETVHLLAGGTAGNEVLNRLGDLGYRLIAVVPLAQIIYDARSNPVEVSNGTQLIFERRKEIE